MKNAIQYLLILFCMQWILPNTLAQIEVKLEPTRQEFLVGESVTFKLTFVNYSDRAVTLCNSNDYRWLNFNIKQRGSTYPVNAKVLAKYPPLTLSPGSKRAYEVDVKPYYNLENEGNYSVTATIVLPGGKLTQTSNNSTFALRQGGVVKSFDVSVRGQRLKLSVKMLAVKGRSCLFGQVSNQDTHGVLGACFLGHYLSFMRPCIMLDRAMNVHVLCQSTPEFFTYSIMDTYGKRRSYKLYRRSGGPVDLISTGGGLRPVGLVPYTPEQRKKDAIHSVSDRPF